MIGRRAFVAGVGLLSVSAVREAWAQGASALPRLALVDPALPVERMVEGGDRSWDALFRGLRELGFVEGETIAIERWTAAGAVDQGGTSQLVVASGPHLIVCVGGFLIQDMSAATITIPIIGLGAFPDGMNLARPGGNVTGITGGGGTESLAEDLELLLASVHGATRVGYVATQRSWDGFLAAAFREAADKLGVTLSHLVVEPPISEPTIRGAFASIQAGTLDALYIHPSAAFALHSAIIAQLALELRLPAMSAFREQVEAGLLIYSGDDWPKRYHRAARYVYRILAGDNPGEMPIEQAIEFGFVINLRTAATLGLTLPPEIMLRATELIQ